MTAARYPTHPVRYVVPFRPGGPPDAVARLVTEGLARRWDQTVEVDNRPGVNGTAGTGFVIHAPPDGHTLLQGTSATHASNSVLFPMLPFDPAKELAPVGVRVNAVAPGVIMTPFHERYSTPAQLEASARGIPMGRLGTAEECVGAYEFLASERMSGYITGQVIEVNGGQLMP